MIAEQSAYRRCKKYFAPILRYEIRRIMVTMKREKFGSRLGFILVSAGCAIGIGNVWKFPYICGVYGGAAFILIYLAFLLILGIPVLVFEFAVGRGSRKSVALSFEELAPGGTL